ncbi:hypothetical protein GCM10027578_06400 [Spirosoma luteolum]
MHKPLRFSPYLVWLLPLLVLSTHVTLGQVDVTYPVERMILQRDNSNKATVQIAGSYAQVLDAVEARAVARTAGQGTTTSWTTLQSNPTNGQFSGMMPVQGGWYRLEVRGLRNGQVVGLDSVARFGVGEVFAIMGHSNAQGSSCVINNTDYCPTIDGAVDDRVTVVPLDQSTPEFRAYEQTADTRYLPGLVFSQLATFSGLSPFARFAWFWGRMGDQLVQRINVPVLIYNGGFGGTNMEQNYKAAYDIPFDHFFVNYSIRMPYVNMRNIMNLYVPSTGVRAVLLHHGENDRGNATSDIYTHNVGVIDKVRQEFNKPNLAWMIAISSYAGGRYQNVRDAQTQVLARANYNVYQGPDLDNMTDRPDGIHYSPSGQMQVAQLWSTAITNSFLQSTQPYMAQLQPLTSIACDSGNTVRLSQPQSVSYTWNTGSTSQTLTVGPGTYSARLRNSQNQISFPPAVTVPAEVRPADPTISVKGSASFCVVGGTVLQSSYAGTNVWNTGPQTATLTVNNSGVYSVQAKGAAYGCLSNPIAYTVSAAGSDLALAMNSSRRSPAVGDTVTFTMTIRNEGTCQVNGVTIQNRLPANVSVVTLPSTLSASNSIITGTISQLQPGQSVSRQYVARLQTAGQYLNAAEISAQSGPDPDSQPNSGTGDGQDDAATTDLRTRTTATALFASPNPNQVPLPAVQSNQPAPDPNKADLSLSMLADRRTVPVGGAISVSLVVSNRGQLPATQVALRSELPAGLQFVSSNAGVTAAGTVLTATIGQIQAGQSALVSYIVKTTAAGSFSHAAEVSASNQPDPDSTPGNGVTNGEDDTARIDIRSTSLTSGGRQAAPAGSPGQAVLSRPRQPQRRLSGSGQ